MPEPTISTQALAEIRASIEPNTGFWQFRLRPRHYVIAGAVAAAIVAALAVVLAASGAIR